MEWALYGGYIFCAVAFFGLEMVGKFGYAPSNTVSANLRALQERYGWKVRGPLLVGLAVLTAHLITGVP